jgi:DNA-binding beta-propeller fold protein YncE
MFVLVLVTFALSVVFLSGCQSKNACSVTDELEYKHIATWDAKSAGMEFSKILGIGIDSKGKVYATAGAGDEGVVVFNKNGKIVDTWGKGFKSKHGLRVFDDKVWVTDRERQVVMEFTLDGKLLRTLGTEGKSGLGRNEFNKPSDMAIGPNGDIYVSDGYANSRVMRFNSRGKYKQDWGTSGDGPGQFKLVHNIAINKDGKVYVADRTNERLQIFDADGKFLDEWKHVGKVYGLYIDCQSRVYITDGASNNVYVTDEHGKILTMFGKIGDGAGEFKMCHSITVDEDGKIYVTEGDGMRIQVFERK